MISGFMIVKDVLKPGYPFVEAITSALPVCDEFLVSDGYSTDGTYDVVTRIADSNRKVKVFRREWPNEKQFSVLGEVTNWLRAKCSGDYIFSIQANEVVHEESIPFLKALPQMCPEAETFSLPFLHLMKNFKFSEQFRLRLSRNLPSIVASGDAWSLGASKKFVRSETFKCVRHPKRLVSYIGRGVQWTYANVCGNPLSRAIYLSKPVYRYWSIFPRDCIEKCLKHKELFNVNDLSQVITTLESHVDDVDQAVFWNLAAEPLRKAPLGYKYPNGLAEVALKDHPKIMQSLLSNFEAKKYYVREELFDQIKGL
jgi:glycosyltransferase involved in cell wall biosynthesis